MFVSEYSINESKMTASIERRMVRNSSNNVSAGEEYTKRMRILSADWESQPPPTQSLQSQPPMSAQPPPSPTPPSHAMLSSSRGTPKMSNASSHQNECIEMAGNVSEFLHQRSIPSPCLPAENGNGQSLPLQNHPARQGLLPQPNVNEVHTSPESPMNEGNSWIPSHWALPLAPPSQTPPPPMALPEWASNETCNNTNGPRNSPPPPGRVPVRYLYQHITNNGSRGSIREVLPM